MHELWFIFFLALFNFFVSKAKMNWAVVALLLLLVAEVGLSQVEPPLSRDEFPPYFIFGAGTSAYQVEGAVAEGGRSPSIWDNFTHAGRALDGKNGDIAADQYHKYKEDVKLMADMGLDAYRFSISWSRLIPDGRGAINEEGLKYYNNLINELHRNGIEPHVTLHHVDHPQILEDEYGGWLNLNIVEDFTAFADTCFREFGDRVKFWTTINQANIFAVGAYDSGILPPSRCSNPFGPYCTVGNSPLEPYIVAHHALLAHASVYKLYRNKYQEMQNGKVGLSLYSFWCEPYSNSTSDAEAAQRSLDFYVGWLLDPLVNGDYPKIMKKNVGRRMPSFSRSQSRKVKGSFDFIGLNHYSTVYVKDFPVAAQLPVRDFNLDILAAFAFSKEDDPGSQAVPGLAGLPIAPWGLQSLLLYLKKAYANPPVYVQENGLGLLFNETLNDTARVDYLKGYINATLSAIRDGSNTRGYFVWSFLDVFELLTGYLSRYGLYHVDFSSKNLTREPKLSSQWYSNFLNPKKINNLTPAKQSNYEII